MYWNDLNIFQKRFYDYFFFLAGTDLFDDFIFWETGSVISAV